jgi:branched-chain amino acid transport system ATP-binding protein
MPAELETPLLDVRSLSVSYRGAGTGVKDATFSVRAGEVVALLGPNGAGKTSTLRGVAGFLKRDVAYRARGSVLLDGQDLTSLGPVARARRGVAIVPEENKVFSGLTVHENLELGRIAGGRNGPFARHRHQALEVFPALAERLTVRAGYLSGGQRQMLALATALCAGPRLMVVDELTLGLSPELVTSMVAALKTIAAGGLPILIAEQNVQAVLELSNTVHVLDGGRIVASGEPHSLIARSEIANVYLGRR